MTHSNFQTNNKLGQPLAAPSPQTILPIINGGNGNIVGFYPIVLTTFDGSEREFTLSQGEVPITSVTLPAKIDDGSGYGVQQYMAVVFDAPLDKYNEPWIGYSEFVSINETGYEMRWYQPTVGRGWVLQLGTLLKALSLGMDQSPPAGNVPVPPTAVNGTMRWAGRLNLSSTEYECAFFDFNWVALFQAKCDNELLPKRLEVLSNPPGGEFKSTLVPYPSATPLGLIEFNTVRILRLKNAVAADYVFNYRVVDSNNLSVNVELTLTVV